jgi:peptidoglycan hydrolase-like amidase
MTILIRRGILLATLLVSLVSLQSEPSIRIGLSQSAGTFTIRSSENFIVQQVSTRSAKFTPVLSIDDSLLSRVLGKDDIRYRMVVELDGGRYIALPLNTHVRISPPPTARLQLDDRSYRGYVEVFGNARNTFTIVNELPLENYLLGVVPNELSPSTFGQLEALKAQAVAARTYAIKNMGQSKLEGYDICNTDACQVYFGAGTEDPLATQAVRETRGMIATYNGQPINALYSSTCGGRTEAAENIFQEKLPYLVSVLCEFKHPQPLKFASTRLVVDYKDAVLSTAGVTNFTQLRKFMGMTGSGEPTSLAVGPLATWLRATFYPNVKPGSDLEFMVEQGILPGTGRAVLKEVLFRLIDKKSAFEWQQGVLTQWDGQTMKLNVGGKIIDFKVNPNALYFFRMGDERTAMKEGEWIGGELLEFRVVDGVIQMIVYRKNWVNPSADRYSRLAEWQVHKTRQEIDMAFKSLNLGEIRGMRVIERGPSERPVSTEIAGSLRKVNVRALNLRTMLGLRDSLFYFDEERNAKGELIGMSFYGQGWGHGVGMCQVGAYGMALDGAMYDQILKKYYTGIDLKKSYQ